MSIHIAASVVANPTLIAAGVNANNPRIGWHNLVTTATVFATQEAADFPASYLALPATYLYWKGTSSAEQNIGIGLDAAETVNYVGIARHNLATVGAQVTVQSSADGVIWSDITTPLVPASDRVLIIEFDDTVAQHFRVNLVPSSGIPEAGVLYIGEILRLQRRIYVGHTPLPYGRQSEVSTKFTEDGQFLGRIVHRRMYRSNISQQNVTPDFYRTYIEPFFEEAVQSPFFVAWRPGTYPTETGYVWLTGDPQMQNQRANGMVSIDFAYQGIR